MVASANNGTMPLFQPPPPLANMPDGWPGNDPLTAPGDTSLPTGAIPLPTGVIPTLPMDGIRFEVGTPVLPMDGIPLVVETPVLPVDGIPLEVGTPVLPVDGIRLEIGTISVVSLVVKLFEMEALALVSSTEGLHAALPREDATGTINGRIICGA